MVLRTALTFVARAALAGLALMLAACESEKDLKRAPAAAHTGITGSEFFWFSESASRLLIMMSPEGVAPVSDMATALAWPDRLVLVLPTPAQPMSCSDVVSTASAAGAAFAAGHNMPAPGAPLVIGLGGAGDAAVRFALSAMPRQSQGAIALDTCPAPAPAFCSGEPPAGARGKIPLVAIPDDGRCTPQDLAPTLARFDDGRAVVPVPDQRIELASTVASQMLGTLPSALPRTALDLPLVELPAKGDDDRLAIILTGDGGWANIDKKLGEELSKRGVAVVGFDTLKYFWKRKDPAAAARDLARVIAHYSDHWRRGRVMLIGYSFGADVLPFLWNNLDDAARAKVADVTLLGLAEDASFEITVGGWVGIAPSEAVPTIPEIMRIVGPHVVCIYGQEEDSDACPQLRGSKVEVIALPGDHHFDGHYQKLAEMVLARFAR